MVELLNSEGGGGTSADVAKRHISSASPVHAAGPVTIVPSLFIIYASVCDSNVCSRPSLLFINPVLAALVLNIKQAVIEPHLYSLVFRYQ